MTLATVVLAAAAAFGANDVDRLVEAEMARQQVPGLTLAVVREGRIVRLGAYGYGDLEWKARATPETRFEIASVTKMFTGAAARVLVEDGRLDLEAPLSRFFEGLPEAWAPIRVRHLLDMSAGFPDDWGGPLLPYDKDVITEYDDASMLRMFTTLAMEAPVGVEFHYGSPGYAIVGMIVSKITGQPLADFMRDRVFGPAGMAHSSFVDNAAIVPERARGYRREGAGIRRGFHLGQYLHARPDVGMLTTARDLAAWTIALRDGKIVKEPAKLWAGATADSGRPLDYSYGWFTGTLLGYRAVGHGGRYRTGFRSTLFTFPDDDLSVIVLTNGDWIQADRFAALLARTCLPMNDPEAAAALADTDPARTARAVRALESVARGQVDPGIMTPDALEPESVASASEMLKGAVSYKHAGHGRPARPLSMHGHTLVDFTTIRVQTPSRVRYITLYRDDRGRFAFVEATE